MRVRRGFTVALIVAVVTAALGLAVAGWRRHADQRNLRTALTVARQLRAPASAVASSECHGDGLVACWAAPSTPAVTTQALAASMRGLGTSPAVRCDRVRVGIASAATTADECHVVVRYGARAVVVFVDPHWQRTSTASRVDGSLVSVSAA